MPYCDIETDTIFLHNSPSNNKIIWMFQRQHLYNSRSVMWKVWAVLYMQGLYVLSDLFYHNIQ